MQKGHVKDGVEEWGVLRKKSPSQPDNAILATYGYHIEMSGCGLILFLE